MSGGTPMERIRHLWGAMTAILSTEHKTAPVEEPEPLAHQDDPYLSGILRQLRETENPARSPRS